MVKLGEMAVLTGAKEEVEQLKQVEIARAPLPGAARRITPDWIKTRLACAGFDLKTISIKSPLTVVLVSESQTVKAADIVETAKRYVMGQLTQTDINYHLDPDTTTTDSVVSAGKVELVTEPLTCAITPGRQQLCVDVLVDGVVCSKKSVSLSLKASGPVLIATQAIKAKEALNSSNTKLEEREITTASARFLTTIPDDSRVTNRPISAGSVISSDMIVTKPAVAKGDSVIVVVVSGAVKVVVRGIASQDGATGDNIRVSVPGSREEVQATVTEPGLVEVKA
jgi:flagella basal body P-ring formation protein FlgA